MRIPSWRVLCLGLVALLAALSVVHAQGDAESKHGFLWKVRSPTATVHLFGSLHLASEDCYPLPESVESAFDDSEYLVVEVNISPEKEAELGMMMLAKGTLPEGETLAAQIPEALQAQLASYLEAAGIPAALFERFKPWMVALTVAVLEAGKLGLDPELGIERHFLKKADEGKTVLELESMQAQLELFDGLPPDLQRQFLQMTLLEIEEMLETMTAVIEAWKAGDTEAMQELLFQSLEDSPELKPIYDKLFTERNHSMAETIAGYLKTDSTYFVLVGAGHLVGETGIPVLLEKRGFKVKRR